MGSSSDYENGAEKAVLCSKEDKLEQSRVNLMRSIVEAKDSSAKVSDTKFSPSFIFPADFDYTFSSTVSSFLNYIWKECSVFRILGNDLIDT